MKIKEYFERKRETQLNDVRKNKINQDIWLKIENNTFWKNFYKRFSFYWKVTAYTFFIFVLFFSFYTSFVDYNKNENFKKIIDAWTWYLLQKDKQQPKSLAKAENIWDIIEAHGDFTIMQDWKKYKTNKLYDWNTMILTNNAKLRFQVNSWVEAYIKGPAKLNIKYLGEINWNKNFVLNMIEWEYIEVKSENREDQNVIIKTNKFEVESKDISQKMDISIRSENDWKILENKWWELVIKKTIKNKKIYSNIWKNEKVKINDEIRHYREVKEISKKVQNKNMEINYHITGDNKKDAETISKEQKNDKELLDTKKIIKQKKIDKLKKLLYTWFLKNDVKRIVENYLNWNKRWLEISYENFLSRILKIYQLFDIRLESEIIKSKTKNWNISIDDVFVILDQLIAKIQNQYYVPEKYTEKLKKTLWWIVILQKNEFWKFKWKNLEISEIISKLNLEKYEKTLTIK